jgi:hypothetical protein
MVTFGGFAKKVAALRTRILSALHAGKQSKISEKISKFGWRKPPDGLSLLRLTRDRAPIAAPQSSVL